MDNRAQTSYPAMRTIMKLLAAGVVYLIITIIVQGFISPAIFGSTSSPANEIPDFGKKISPILFITGITFALFFSIFRNRMPGRTVLSRGLLFSLFVYFSNYFPQNLGISAMRYDGVNSATLIQGLDYPSWISDFIATAITGIIIAALFKRTEESSDKPARIPIRAVVIPAIVFPVCAFIAVSAGGMLVPDSNILNAAAQGAKAVNAAFFYGSFILTGAIIAVFFITTSKGDRGFREAMRFVTQYFLLIWTPVV
ncbi:MAG TPA: hypothetical protein PKK43_08195, partial [Spirochaetota bacterium]|nr:hypothetical protein [Spirochaetota bacterium]